jgi:hypothetical protein
MPTGNLRDAAKPKAEAEPAGPKPERVVEIRARLLDTPAAVGWVKLFARPNILGWCRQSRQSSRCGRSRKSSKGRH